MKSFLNDGVYEVDLKGETSAMFNGKHPSVIIQTLKELDVFYIIPLTSYTKERWNKLRSYGCCRIPSTNSIARIDKMQIRERSDISQRYYSDYELIIPTYEEMKKVHKKILEYTSLSLQKAEKTYNKYYVQYVDLKKGWDIFLNTSKCEGTDFYIISQKPLKIGYPLNRINNLTHDDIKNIFLTRTNKPKIAYNKSVGILEIELKKVDK